MPFAARFRHAPSHLRRARPPFAVLLLLAGVVVVMAAAGCSPSGDRCYVEPARHESARRLYARSGSIQVVRETLADADWLPCEIEQTIARLEQENGL
jgi:hypothetical protein